jgi:indoleamine 2,3-dioxygenase
MRNYMPGPHRRFLEYLGKITNIRPYAMSLPASSDVRQAYNTVVMKLGGFRDKHIQIVTRYVINPAKQSRMRQNDKAVSGSVQRVNLASATSRSTESVNSISSTSPELSVKSAASSITSVSDSEVLEQPSFTEISEDRIFYGTGGTALIPFLKTTRDETKAAARYVD